MALVRKYSGACLPDSSGAPPSNSSKPNSPLFCEQFAFQWWRWWWLWWGWPRWWQGLWMRSWSLVTAARATLLKLCKNFDVSFERISGILRNWPSVFLSTWSKWHNLLVVIWNPISTSGHELFPNIYRTKYQTKYKKKTKAYIQTLFQERPWTIFTSTSTSRPSRSTAWRLHH